MEYLYRCSYCKRIGTKEEVEEHEKTCVLRKCEFKKLNTKLLHRGFITTQECIHPKNDCGLCWGVGHDFCPLTKNNN